MDDEHERSLVAWANTFSGSFPPGAAPATSLSHFYSGDALIPIARTIVGNHNNIAAANDTVPAASGWAGVFSHMRFVGLIEEDAQAPGEEEVGDEEAKLELAVTCLEELLRYTVAEECAGRETFIRQIMSLDADAQTTLRHIIVGDQYIRQQSEATSPRADSPCRDNSRSRSISSISSSFRGSPGYSSPPTTGRRGHRTRSSPCESPCGGDDSGEDILEVRSWYSPHPKGSIRRQSIRAAGGRTAERAARVGPKPIHREGRFLEMDTDEEEQVHQEGEEQGASSAESLIPPAALRTVNVSTAGWAVSSAEVADLKAEISRLKGQLEEHEDANARALADVKAQRDAAIESREGLSDDLQRARQAAERLTVSEEEAVIAVEKEMRAKHEKEVAVLRERASKAEERAIALEPLEDEVLRLRDDVDILRPVEAKLSKVEENLSRCRDKIQELSGLPGQLKREEDAHAQVLDRCLELETEVSQIPQLKRQVDRYRRLQTDLEVTNREQARELEVAQEEVSRLSREVQAHVEGSGAARDEQRRLRNELNSRSVGEADGCANGGGIGEGVSELNPELMEELARLRLANEQLKAKVDYNTVDTIRELEEKADDSNRLANSFHENLTSERQLRSAAEASLAAARTRIAELESELVALREEHRRTVARLEAEAAAAAAAASAALVAANEDSRERLAAAEEAAASALREERVQGAERLAAAEREAKRVQENLRGQMKAAAEAAEDAAAEVARDREEERGEFRAKIEAVEEAAARGEQCAAAELAAAVEAHAKEVRETKDVMDGERKEAAQRLVQAGKKFETEAAEIKKELEAKLDEERRSSADEIAEARRRTAEEEKGRLEECRLKEEARQELQKLEDTYASGKQAALKAIDRLETNARETREEAEAMRQEQQADHEAKLAVLNAEFESYRQGHTIDDATYLKDTDDWENTLAAKKKMIADLQGRSNALEKEKRRLEREKTFYWGQAEELRMSAAAGGRTDPTKEADHQQLVEQLKELVEENRDLRQRIQQQGSDDLGCDGVEMTPRKSKSGRWGSSGVAAMRKEHEAEMTALTEEKRDLLLKYHDTSSKLQEQKRLHAELSEEVEEIRKQLVSLQYENKRQEKKLRDSESFVGSEEEARTGRVAAAFGLHGTDGNSQKENQPNSPSPRPASGKPKTRSTRGLSHRKFGGVSREEGSTDGVAASSTETASGGGGKGGRIGAASGKRGPLRGLSNTAQQQRRQKQEGSVKVPEKPEETLVSGDGGAGARRTQGVADETPPECVQS